MKVLSNDIQFLLSGGLLTNQRVGKEPSQASDEH
jgi:hypothetical protein